MVVTQHPRRQSGFSLLELTVATLIGAILLASLNSLVGVALTSGAQGHRVNELAYQGQFVMDRIAEQVRAAQPQQLTTPTAGTTGTWLAPVMYCRISTTRQSIETVTTDASCAGTGVIARNVSAFTATVPSMLPLDRHTGIFSMTLDDGVGNTLALTMQLRLGGGTK